MDIIELNKLIINVINAADKVISDIHYEEYVAMSPENKEWADAFNALREYSKTIKF